MKMHYSLICVVVVAVVAYVVGIYYPQYGRSVIGKASAVVS